MRQPYTLEKVACGAFSEALFRIVASLPPAKGATFTGCLVLIAGAA
jgi:hypothetical protein